MGMGIVHAKFETVPAVIPADGVGKLGATFIRKRRPLQKRRHAHVKAVGYELRMQKMAVRIQTQGLAHIGTALRSTMME